MSRVNAFGRMGNDNGRSVSVGGRGPSDSVWATLNTDNGSKSNCALRVSATVDGERHRGGKPRKTCWSCRRRWERGETTCPDCGVERQGIDTRTSYFEIGLPDQADEHCQVEISVGNPGLRKLVAVGAFLCAIKGAQEVVNGEPEQGKATIENAAQILGEMEAEAEKNMPRVTLPGGVTLAHALACVKIVEDLIDGPAKEN